ncbi:hypothetical protein BDZ97DRAFT_1925433 [Flammula alnicola]|nr:hypothetical protein BDZ97DRAFT_1925433 [Flammula alnicola]
MIEHYEAVQIPAGLQTGGYHHLQKSVFIHKEEVSNQGQRHHTDRIHLAGSSRNVLNAPSTGPQTRQGRPVSAVYIGKASSPNLQDFTHSAQFSSAYPSLIDGTPPGLPDLPEPPSPVSSVGSVKSGLPSPPATNSTGSGSTGDPATIALRERPLSLHSNSSASTSSGSHHTVSTPMKRSSNVTTSRSSSRLGNQDDTGAEGDFDDDYDKENDNDNESNQDGDDTARLDRKLLSNSNHDDKPKSSSENVLALQRVRSLAQRNRLVCTFSIYPLCVIALLTSSMFRLFLSAILLPITTMAAYLLELLFAPLSPHKALDKLARLGSPSPARPNTPNSRSPAPLHAPTTSSRLSQPPRQVRALPEPPQDYGRSGSETERESTTQHTNTQSQSSHSSSSHSYTSSPRHQSATLSSSNRSVTPPPTTYNNSPASRHRHLSAPDSPNKARRVAAGSTSTSSSSNSRSNSSRSPSNRRRHRSMASMSQLQLADFEEEEDVHDDANLKTATGTRGHTRDRTLNERI